LRWLIGTQTFWILLASVGEVSAFGIIMGYLIVHKVRSFPPVRRSNAHRDTSEAQ
jgi:hypothetical protein